MDVIQSGQPFHCVICLELVYKPIAQVCGHLFCFWCVHKAMSSTSESYCPLCRRPYMYFPRICELLHFFLKKALPQEYGERAREVKEDEEQRRVFSPQFEEETPGSDEMSKSDSHGPPLGNSAIVESRPTRHFVSMSLEASPSVVVDVSMMSGGDANSVEFVESSPMEGMRMGPEEIYAPTVIEYTTGTGLSSLPMDASVASPGVMLRPVSAPQTSTFSMVPDFDVASSHSPAAVVLLDVTEPSSGLTLSPEPEICRAFGSGSPVSTLTATGSSSATDVNEPPPSGTSSLSAVPGGSNASLASPFQTLSSFSDSQNLVEGVLSSLGTSASASSAVESHMSLAEAIVDSPTAESDALLPGSLHIDACSHASPRVRANAGVSRYRANSQILQNLLRTYEFVREGLFSVTTEASPGFGSSNCQQETCRTPDGHERGNGNSASLTPLPTSSGTGAEVGCSSMLSTMEETAILPRLLAAATLSDFLCSVCNQLLHRPVVLNCGHAFCRVCVLQLDSANLSCSSCQIFHPAGEPQVCLELHYFLELAFLQEYAQRQEEQALLQGQRRLEKASTSMDDVEPVTPSKEDARDPVHEAVGCDGCGMMPIIGRRFQCEDCPEWIGYDLCGNCYKSPLTLSGRFNQRHRSDHRMVERVVRPRSSIPRFLRESMGILQGPDEDANNMSRPHAVTDGFEDAENDPEDDGGEHSQDDGDVETYFSLVYNA